MPSINTNTPSDDTIISLPTTDDISEINSNPSTYLSPCLFSQSKPILNKHNPNLILTKQNLSSPIHRSISTSDCIDWTNTSSMQRTTIEKQLKAIDFLQDYLQNDNHEVFIDLLHHIAHEINADQQKKSYSYSAMNNNHFHLSPTHNPHFQLSYNKEKKNKKEKSEDKQTKESKTEDKKKEDNNHETTSKKPKKHKEKSKKTEETVTTTTTTDSEVIPDSPVLLTPPRTHRHSSRSPAETIGFPSLSIPVSHSGGSSIANGISPDLSRIYTPQQPNIAHFSSVQHQLQTDQQNPSLIKTTNPYNNTSVQQQLQSLSQMARDGDEILITLSVNALTQKQQINTQSNPYFSQPWNQMMPPSSGLLMPRNLEIVAKGFARMQNEHPQLPSPNTHMPPPHLPTMCPWNQSTSMMVHPPFAPRYPIPCNSATGPPSAPIGPPIQPIFAPPNTMMTGGFIRPHNYTDQMSNIRSDLDAAAHRSYLNTNGCDYLCQSSFQQPDFRGRPSPNVPINPYLSNRSPTINFSAKRSSKHRTKNKSKQQQQYYIHPDNITRTYSSIY